jgi:putative heme transporter
VRVATVRPRVAGIAVHRAAPAEADSTLGVAARTGVGAAPERRRRPRWRLLLGAAVVALLGVEAAVVAPTLGGALSALAGAHLGWVAVAVLAEAVSMDLFARMRRRLLAAAGLRVGVRETTAAVYVANAVHRTVPGGAAFSTAYVYRWMRERGAGAATGTWVLLAGGLVSTSALAALAVIGPLLVGATTGWVALAVDLALVVALVVAARALRRRPDLPLVAGRRLLRWANRVLRRPAERGVDALERGVRQLRSVRPHPRDWAAAVAYGTGNWVFDGVCLAAAAVAVGAHGLTLPLLLITYTTGMAAAGISLLPGGLGVVDAAMVLALVAGHIPVATALPAVLLYRLISLVAVVATGWIVAAVQARRSRTAVFPLPPARDSG